MTTKARGAEEFVPAETDLPTLQEAAQSCRGCELYKNATQTVFGDGDPGFRIMLLGEKPGIPARSARTPLVVTDWSS